MLARQIQNNEQLIIALVTTSTIKDAALKAGVSEATIYKRLKDKEFKKAYADYRQKLIENSATALSLQLGDAVTALGEIVRDKETPAAVRLQAADTIIKDSLRIREHIQLTSDVELLKAAVFINE